MFFHVFAQCSFLPLIASYLFLIFFFGGGKREKKHVRHRKNQASVCFKTNNNVRINLKYLRK